MASPSPSTGAAHVPRTSGAGFADQAESAAIEIHVKPRKRRPAWEKLGIGAALTLFEGVAFGHAMEQAKISAWPRRCVAVSRVSSSTGGCNSKPHAVRFVLPIRARAPPPAPPPPWLRLLCLSNPPFSALEQLGWGGSAAAIRGCARAGRGDGRVTAWKLGRDRPQPRSRGRVQYTQKRSLSLITTRFVWDQRYLRVYTRCAAYGALSLERHNVCLCPECVQDFVSWDTQQHVRPVDTGPSLRRVIPQCGSPQA